MTDEELKLEYLAKHGVTKCPTRRMKDGLKSRKDLHEFLAIMTTNRRIKRKVVDTKSI